MNIRVVLGILTIWSRAHLRPLNLWKNGLKKDLCPVRPSMHYHMGGIPTNEYGQVCPEVGSVMPGLFAVGECASASFQGFNRLGTNSLLELITMAKFAGEKAAEKLGGALEESGPDAGEVSRAEFAGYLEATGREQIGTLRSELQQTMTENVGVFRNEAGLNRAIEKIAELKERSGNVALRSKSLHANQELLQRWELENLLMTARVVAHAARERRESRGGHAREDFPERKNEFNRHTLARIDSEGRVMLGSRPVDISLFEAKGKHYERFGYIERKY